MELQGSLVCVLLSVGKGLWDPAYPIGGLMKRYSDVDLLMQGSYQKLELLVALETELNQISWPSLLKFFNISFKLRSSGICVINCIFHQDRRPSLFLKPNSGWYKCYGCQEEGSKLEFLQHMLFDEAEVSNNMLEESLEIVDRIPRMPIEGQLSLPI